MGLKDIPLTAKAALSDKILSKNLEEAKKLQREGKDFSHTGWHRGILSNGEEIWRNSVEESQFPIQEVFIKQIKKTVENVSKISVAEVLFYEKIDGEINKVAARKDLSTEDKQKRIEQIDSILFSPQEQIPSLYNKIQVFTEKNYTLNEIVDTSVLYKLYPELKDLVIKFDNSKQRAGGFSASQNTLYINLNGIKEHGIDYLKETLHHELTHVVQKIDMDGLRNSKLNPSNFPDEVKNWEVAFETMKSDIINLTFKSEVGMQNSVEMLYTLLYLQKSIDYSEFTLNKNDEISRMILNSKIYENSFIETEAYAMEKGINGNRVKFDYLNKETVPAKSQYSYKDVLGNKSQNLLIENIKKQTQGMDKNTIQNYLVTKGFCKKDITELSSVLTQKNSVGIK